MEGRSEGNGKDISLLKTIKEILDWMADVELDSEALTRVVG